MRSHRFLTLAALAAVATLAFMLRAGVAHSQLTMVESGFVGATLSNDLAKQIELGVGPDTCLYYGSNEGLRRRCGPFDPGTICDATLTFPVGIAFSTGGSFGTAMYVADFGISDIHKSPGCSASTLFATIGAPGAIAFPPSGSPYGNFLYACEAFDGPIYRVSSTGVVTTWLEHPVAYLRFGPGGAWGTGLYATEYTADDAGIARISSAGVVTPLIGAFLTPEGFDWAFGGDLFATDVSMGEIYRVKSNGTRTLFATLPGAADLAYRPGEKALYAVSTQGGLYRIVASNTSDVGDASRAGSELTVVPTPTRGTCSLRFATRVGGLTRASVVDAAGRVVRRLHAVWQPAGNSQSLAWDGRDDSGTLVPPGVYFARVVVAGETLSARVTIIR